MRYLGMVVALVGACGGSDLRPDERGCEAMGAGSGTPLTAAASGNAGPAASSEESRYQVQLTGSAPPYSGVISFTASRTATYYLFFDVDPSFAVTAAGGQITAQGKVNIASCDDVAVEYTYNLEPGDYELEVTSSTLASLGFVYFSAPLDENPDYW